MRNCICCLVVFVLVFGLNGLYAQKFHVRFDPAKESFSADQSVPVLSGKLRLGTEDKLQLMSKHEDELGYTHERYQLYHKGIKVEHGIAIAHARGNQLTAINGEGIVFKDIVVAPTLTETVALQNAIKHIGAKHYQWENEKAEDALRKKRQDLKATYYPKGELVIVQVDGYDHPRRGSYRLAYKFDIYSSDPVMRDFVYVDAHDGSIVMREAILKTTDAVGSAQTRYSGTRQINTESVSTYYRLRDNTRGKGVITAKLDANNTPSDVTDNDNNWTSAEFKNASNDDAALDAHWGAMMTYDYWKNVHGRNSYDNQGSTLWSYVHYGSANYENASWDGVDNLMLYGDGSGNPYTSIDICAHEIGHAITQYTCNLVYSGESGALNEGFSDIWGACVEYYADPTKQTWLIGEEVIGNGGYIRSMSSPPLKKQAWTYKDYNWYTGVQDYGGVHTNSGVLNFCFYFLSKGGTFQNTGLVYTTPGIGIDKAAKIAYRAENVYLTPNAQYSDAMAAFVQSAIDLYGVNSTEVSQTISVWNFAGVYDQQLAAPSNLVATLPAIKQLDLSWTDNSPDETGFVIERGTKSNNYSVIGIVGANVTTFSDKTIDGTTTYTYRVKALKNYVPSAYSATLDAGTLLTPVIGNILNENTSGFDFTWFPVAVANSYLVDVATDANFTSFVPGYQNLLVSGLSVSVSNLTTNTSYFCRVSATNGVVKSPFSTTVTITTLVNYVTPNEAQLIGLGGNSIYRMNRDGSGLHVLKNTGISFLATYSLIQDQSGNVYGLHPYYSTTVNSMVLPNKLDVGRIFKIDTDGNYSIIHDFKYLEGSSPEKIFIGVDGKLWGITSSGGSNNGGTIFNVNLDGTNFTKVLDLSMDVLHTLIQAPDGTLYGSERLGPKNGDWGFVFKVNPDGSNYTVLHVFDQHYEGYPMNIIVGKDGNIYGLTYNYNVTSQIVNLYRITTSDGVYSRLTNGTGGIPYANNSSGGWAMLQNAQGEFIIGEAAWYANTYLFAINADGSSPRIIHKFSNPANGGGITHPAFIGPDNMIYGAYFSLSSNYVYKVDQDGSNFALLTQGSPATGRMNWTYSVGLVYVKLNQSFSGATTIDKIFGDADFDLPLTINSGLPLTLGTPADPNVAVVKNGKISLTGVGTTTMTITQIGNDDYNPVTATITIHVAPKALPPALIVSTAHATRLNEVLVPIAVKNFSNIVSAQLEVDWDPATATFVDVEGMSITSMGQGSFGASQVSAGKLTLSWFDLNIVPQTLADGSALFNIRFKLTGNYGASTAVTITNVELSQPGSPGYVPVANVTTQSGSVSIDPTITTSAKILYVNNQPVGNVQVDMTGSATQSVSTDATGSYTFTLSPLALNETYTLTPSKLNDPNPTNGIDVADVTTIHRHILNIQSLTTPQQFVAADVNNSGTVSTIDLVFIQSLILNMTNNYPGGSLWTFMPSIFTLDPANPYTYPTTATVALSDLEAGPAPDFTAIKLGDVDFSRDNTQQGRVASGQQVTFDIRQEMTVSDDGEEKVIEIPIRAKNFSNLSGYQFTVTWDASNLEYTGVTTHGTKATFGDNQTTQGKLTALWYEPSGKSASLTDGDELFTLQFKSKGGTYKDVNITGEVTPIVVIDHNLQPASATITWSELEKEDYSKLTSFYPNPFSEIVAIEFYTDQEEESFINITDALGRNVLSQWMVTDKGRNRITWDGKDTSGATQATGVYIVELTVGGKLVKGKVVKR